MSNLFGFKSLKFRTKDAKNERNLKETLFQINFQLRRSQDMYSKAQNIENFKAVQFCIQELIYSLVHAKAKVLILANGFCSQLLTIIHSTALPILLKIPSKLEAIMNITILFSEVLRSRIKSVFKSVICIQNAFGRAMTPCLRGRKGKMNPSSARF